MVGAGLVLLATNRRFARSAAIQALPPLVAIVATLVLR
jgi:putative membrane protein